MTRQAGERRGPPEDVGGVSGYERYLNILADPDHEEHQDMLSWRGKFDPEAFSVDQGERQIAQAVSLPAPEIRRAFPALRAGQTAIPNRAPESSC